MNKSCVYWIHSKTQTDMFNEGYIGISCKGARTRFTQHLHAVRSGSNLPVHNAMRKYGDDIVCDTIVQADYEYCLELEYKLRPTPSIGYNVSIGGTEINRGRVFSAESRAKMSKSQKGRVASEETKIRMSVASLARNYKHSEETLKLMSNLAKKRDNSINISKASEANRLIKPWNKPNASIEVWKIADKVFNRITQDNTIGSRKLAKEFDTTYSKLAVIYKNIKAGWNPLEDEDWLVFSSKL